MTERAPIYRPFTGGGSPTEDRQHENTRALTIAVEGTVFATGLEAEKTLWAVKGSRMVTYDRWGFCNHHSDNINKVLDQVDFDEAYKYLMESN